VAFVSVDDDNDTCGRVRGCGRDGGIVSVTVASLLLFNGNIGWVPSISLVTVAADCHATGVAAA
jgi:hypothetical protein